ncbi:MAG: flavodoxin family protein [Deltaproteobacteria bacterium]|nr:flavodoxin family protein [Candidatus Brocadiaceae bacterium]MCP4369779.1 flavodoxin family protein [Deltaproteobacteria bacterium]
MKPAYVLGISGSPRKNGNTELLIREFMKGAMVSGYETELFILTELKISPCTSCDSCQSTGKCVINDDMQLMHKKLLEADCIVFASPIYFGGVSAQLKSFIDRCQALWSRKYILKKALVSSDKESRLGYFISTAGSKDYDKVFDGAVIIIKTIFNTLDIKYKGELLFKDMEKKGDIIMHPNALNKAYEAGASLGFSKK